MSQVESREDADFDIGDSVKVHLVREDRKRTGEIGTIVRTTPAHPHVEDDDTKLYDIELSDGRILCNLDEEHVYEA